MSNTVHVQVNNKTGEGNIRPHPSRHCTCNLCRKAFGSPTKQRSDKHTGQYIGRVRLRHINGTGKRKSFYGESEDAVREQMDEAKHRAEISDGSSKDITVWEYLNEWYPTGSNSRGEPLALKTIASRIVCINRMRKHGIGDIPLTELTSTDIESMYKKLRANKRNYSASSLRQVHSILNKALKEAHEVKQLIKNNPMVAVQNKPSQPKPNRVEYLSVAEVEKLLALNDEWTPFFTLMIQTGLRSGEQVGLKWDKVFLPDNETDDGYLDVDLCVQRVPKTLSEKPLRITTPKNEESRRRVPFNSDVVRMLKAQKDRQHILRGNDIVNQADYDIAPMWNETGFVFTDEQGNHLDPTKPFRELQNAMKTIGVERHIRIHDLRHTCANLLRREGATIENIQALLGHSSYKTTADIYYSILKDEQKEIIPAKMKATIKVPVPSKTN